MNNIATVYFDMDRVLCDFASQAAKYKVLKKNNRINWLKVFLIGSRFWSEMPSLPETQEFVPQIINYCKSRNVEVKVLSSVRLTSGHRGKRKWCREHLPLKKDDIILVKKAELKASFAAPSSLLIDDNSENVQAFISGGGQGYKFSLWTKESYKDILRIIDSISSG